VAQVAVCSQRNKKHTNTVWAERTAVELKSVGASCDPVGFKRLIMFGVFFTVVLFSDVTAGHKGRYFICILEFEFVS